MDSWVWMLVCLGLAILFAFFEVFVPSGGILAFLAAAALFGSIVFAFLENPFSGGVYAIGIVVGIPILLWYLFKWWPHSIMGRQILLDPEDDPALKPDPELLALKKLVGKRGVAKSKMMLSGLIEVEGKRLNALSESETVEPGEAILVIRVDGINVLVRKVVETPVQTTRTVLGAEKAPDVEKVEDPFA